MRAGVPLIGVTRARANSGTLRGARIRSPRRRAKFFEAYVAARREFMIDVATSIGGRFAVIDFAGDGMPITHEVVEPGVKH